MSKFSNEVNCILGRIKRGDNSQKQVLCEVTYNHLKVIAFKYAFNKNEYEDILIESYLRIFKYISTFNLMKDGYNWMCKIVQNVAYDFNKGIVPTVPLEDISLTKIFGDEIEKVVGRDEVLKEVCRLSEYEQRLIYLKFYEDMSYADMAKILNSKKSTVHKQTLNVLDKIKSKLE